MKRLYSRSRHVQTVSQDGFWRDPPIPAQIWSRLYSSAAGRRLASASRARASRIHPSLQAEAREDPASAIAQAASVCDRFRAQHLQDARPKNCPARHRASSSRHSRAGAVQSLGSQIQEGNARKAGSRTVGTATHRLPSEPASVCGNCAYLSKGQRGANENRGTRIPKRVMGKTACEQAPCQIVVLVQLNKPRRN